MAGQDVDAYLKEMEEVHRQTQAEKAAQLQSRMDAMSQQQQQQQPEVQPRRFGAVPPGPPPGLPPSFAVSIFCHLQRSQRIGVGLRMRTLFSSISGLYATLVLKKSYLQVCSALTVIRILAT